MHTDFIDAAAAVLLRLHRSVCPGQIFREEIKRQPVFASGDRIQKLINLAVFVGNDRQQGREELVFDDQLIDPDRVDDRCIVFEGLRITFAAKQDAFAV